MGTFGSIHNHTDYSNVKGMRDSTIKVEKLIDRAIELNYCGIAITDHAVISSHAKALNYLDKIGQDKIKLGLGNEIYVTEKLEDNTFYHLVVVAKDYEGYKLLRQITNQSWKNRYMYKGVERTPITFNELASIVNKNKGRLIVTSACLGSYLGKYVSMLILEKDEQKKLDLKVKIHQFITYALDLFGEDFYIELQPSLQQEQISYNTMVIQIAKAYGINFIIATDSHYLTKQDKEVHRAFLNADKEDGIDSRETDVFYDSTYLHTIEELKEKMDYIDSSDFDLAILNTQIIFKDKIEQFSIFKQQDIPTTDVITNPVDLELVKEYEHLYALATSSSNQDRCLISGAIIKLKEKGLLNRKYLLRLNEEADTILHLTKLNNQDISAYFNTLKKYIDLFWDCGSVVGVGRGSSVGYLFSYLLEITQIDPVQWDLPHWRFLNKERVELPKLYWVV